jgi:uncharacterized phage-associated protein
VKAWRSGSLSRKRELKNEAKSTFPTRQDRLIIGFNAWSDLDRHANIDSLLGQFWQDFGKLSDSGPNLLG